MRNLLIAAAFVALFAVTIGVGTADQEVGEAAPVAEQIAALQQERLGLLRRLAEATDSLYAAGQATLEQVSRRKQALLAAELDLATEPADRVAIRERFLELLRERHAFIEQQFKTGDRTGLELIESQAAMLDAEIALLSETGE